MKSIVYAVFVVFLNLYFFVPLSAQNVLQTFSEQNDPDEYYFGCSVSNAGDVNGDGFDDLIVGALDEKNFTGRVYLFYGGEVIDDIPDLIMSGEASNHYFGRSVTNAGDLNDDGFDDVAIGADGGSKVYVYFGGTNMDNVADLILAGENKGDYFGLDIAGAGDVNNDSIPDLLVAAFGFNNSMGRVYLFQGGSNMDSIPEVIFTGETTGSRFGSSVSTAGDVNNDGFDDVLIGANLYNSGYGRAYLFLGGATMNNTADLIFTGNAAVSYLGSVCNAGDLNHDGFSDFMIGAYGFNSNTGKVDIFFGSSPLNNIADLTLSGQHADDRFGSKLQNAGDVNGDGFNELLIGAPGFHSFLGRMYLYLGSASFDLSTDYTIDGKSGHGRMASSCKGQIDANHDGLDEIFFGSVDYNNRGEAFLYDFSTVSPQSDVTDTTLSATSTNPCFNAFKLVEVAGKNRMVTVQSGAVSDFIAGHTVRFLPGFWAQAGSTVHGYITTDSTFCDGKFEKSLLVNAFKPENAEISIFSDNELEINARWVKVYPNPSKGRFTIECNKISQTAHMTLFNQLGKLVYLSDFDTSHPYLTELSGLQPGLYYLLVRDMDGHFSSKLIITNN